MMLKDRIHQAPTVEVPLRQMMGAVETWVRGVKWMGRLWESPVYNQVHTEGIPSAGAVVGRAL